MKTPSNRTKCTDINRLKTIALLNKLIKTNDDRMKGYQTASTETNEKQLQCAFVDFAHSSQQCRQELVSEILALGGTPTDRTTLSGKIFRVWMDIKASLTGRDPGPILDSCDLMEETANGIYQKIARHRIDLLSSKQHAMILTHTALLKADHTRLENMRNVLVFTD